MRRVRRNTPEIRIEMAPMIDVVFLLLTFFVFAMLLMVRAQVLDISLPSIGAGQPAEDVAAVSVTINAQGETFVDGEPVTREAMLGAIEARMQRTPGAKLYLAADTSSASGDLLKVIDLLSKGGYGNFQLFGTPEAAPGPGPAAAPGPAPTPGG